MIKFIPKGNIINTGWPDIRNKKMKWGTTAIRMEFAYNEGHIKTTKGTKVLAYEFIKSSLKIELYDRKNNNTIKKPKTFFNQFKFDLSYNCFGYIFGESKVFIPDPTAFLTEEYEEVDFENADLIVFKEHQGFGDNGEELINFFHVVKILLNGNVSFKPGINSLVEDVDESLAIDTYNYNRELYLKKK